MKFFTLVLINLYYLSLVLSDGGVKILCPIMCKCYNDQFTKLKTVECIHRNLINTNIEAPVKTEYLDLSNNMITTLDKGSFEGLFHLNKLHLYSNTIASIYADTFLRLRLLTHIDLSDNRIEELDEHLFDANRYLKTVILSYNKFANLINRPFLISDSIEILNLKKCQISHIYSETFKQLSNLKALDLTANSLATLNVQHMRPLKGLNWLDLNGNPWKCDKSLEMVRQWASSNDMMLFLMECAPKQKGMFERIVAPGPNDRKPESREIDGEDDNNSIEDWLIDNDENNPKSRDYKDPKHIHEMLTECQERLVIVSKEQKLAGAQNKFNSTKSVIFFFLGIIIGVLISAAFFFILASRKTRRKWERREFERENSRIVQEEIDEAGNIEIISEPSVPPSRRRRHHQRSQNARPLRPKKSFLASLFERRRAYHRFHPPTLIRRLSRSNLFSSTFGLNRSESRSRLDRQNSRRPNTNNQPSSSRSDAQLLRNNETLIVETPRNMRTFSCAEQDIQSRQNRSEPIAGAESTNAVVPVIPRKSETPPPTYTECFFTFES